MRRRRRSSIGSAGSCGDHRVVAVTEPRLRRLAEELTEAGLQIDLASEWGSLVITEVDYALRPHIHERRVPSVGTIIEPSTLQDRWESGSGLLVTRRPIEAMPLNRSRLFADGLASWLIRRFDGDDEWAVFDRPAGSERDLVVLADAMGATVVQRHPNSSVRIVGEHGVLRWDGLTWFHEPPISSWIDAVTACGTYGGEDVLRLLLEFAVHDLGARGIGALLLFRPDDAGPSTIEIRLPTPPPLDTTRPSDLAPLRHALSQIDGAAVFDVGRDPARARRAAGAEPGGRDVGPGPARDAPHVRPPLQLRRPPLDGDRDQRGRPRHRPAQRRGPRPQPLIPSECLAASECFVRGLPAGNTRMHCKHSDGSGLRHGDGDLGGDGGVVLGEGEVGGDAAAGGGVGDATEHERRDRGAA